VKTVSSRILASVVLALALFATLALAAESRAPLQADQKPLHVTYFFLPG
jgi:hypothetical protein